MRTRPARRALRHILPGLVLATLLVGCGYRLVGADDRPALRLGPIIDLTGEGDLGLDARAHLRRRVGEAPDSTIELRGSIRPGDDRPTAMSAGGEHVRAVGVVVELTAVDPQGTPLAISGPVARSRPLMLSASPTAADRRRSLKMALADALDDALDRLVARLPAEVAP